MSADGDAFLDVLLGSDREGRCRIAAHVVEDGRIAHECWVRGHSDRLRELEAMRRRLADALNDLNLEAAGMSDAARPGVRNVVARIAATAGIALLPCRTPTKPS